MIPEYWARSLRCLVDYREREGDDAFRDIAYRAMVNDPIGALRDLYESLGEPMTLDTEKAMTNWIARNPKAKHGAHVYTAEEFGLDAERIRSMYAFYIERFQVPTEC
jgi:hypothetical protein